MTNNTAANVIWKTTRKGSFTNHEATKHGVRLVVFKPTLSSDYYVVSVAGQHADEKFGTAAEARKFAVARAIELGLI